MQRCFACPNVNACLPPDGPDGNILFIGEAPGINENKRGTVFIGPTGEETNRGYLPLAGLHRLGVMFTNAIRCLPITNGGKLDPNRKKDIELLESCARCHLYPTIETGDFRLLVPLGSFACRAVCPDIDLELKHGFPIETRWGIPAFPMYHPAQGLHEPKKMLHLQNDWRRLKKYMAGTLHLPRDPYPNPDYREVTDVREIQEIDPTIYLAADTEWTKRWEPYCLTYSQKSGVSRLIQANRHDLLQAFQAKLDTWENDLVFHSWLADAPIVKGLGLQFPHIRLIDTMAEVYRLGNLPQGLKTLAFRLLGMAMQDFDDLVRPYSKELVLYYYQLAQSYEWPKPPEHLVRDEEGVYKLYKPQSMNTKLKRFHTDYSKNPEKDVFEMWTKNWTEEQGAIEEKCGEWPGICITHAPFDEVVFYACRDADATGRLWPVIQAMNRLVRKRPQHEWSVT